MGSLNITPEEEVEWQGLPRTLILQKYIKAHRTELCPHCHKFVGNHSVKRMAICAEKDVADTVTEREFAELRSREAAEIPLVSSVIES